MTIIITTTTTTTIIIIIIIEGHQRLPYQEGAAREGAASISVCSAATS